MWCFNIIISGETYIEAGVPYLVTCNVSHFVDIRRTSYNSRIADNDPIVIIIAHSTTSGCFYQEDASFIPCPNSLCSCDTDGLATHWVYNAPTDLSSTVIFRCTSTDSDAKLHTSDTWAATVPCKY